MLLESEPEIRYNNWKQFLILLKLKVATTILNLRTKRNQQSSITISTLQFIINNILKYMSRTLGPIEQPFVQEDSSNQNNQPFYLNDQLPMFLANSASQSKYHPNLSEEMAKCKQLIESLCDNQIKTKESLHEISQFIEQEDLSKGMGYFAAKNLVFLEYMMLIKLYELFRINGKSLTQGNGLQLYKRLAYLKTLLLKLQPIEKKLEYQKNKILKHSEKAIVTKQNKKNDSEEQSNQQVENDFSQEKVQKIEDQIQDQEEEEDQMAFKPRPAALMKVKQQKDIKLVRNDKYEAPKISSNLSKQDKLKRRIQRQKEIRKMGLIRRLQSDLIEDDRAQEQYLGDEINERFKRKFQQKIGYEEQAFVRLPDTKKEKFYMKQMIRNSTRRNQLDEDFKEVQMVRQLFEEENQMQHKLVNEKRKKEQSGKRTSKKEDREMPRKLKKISKK